MELQVLDTVVLTRDLSEHGLRAGDLGAVVELYAPDGLEVEFVQASGKTKALSQVLPRPVARTTRPAVLPCAGRCQQAGRCRSSC